MAGIVRVRLIQDFRQADIHEQGRSLEVVDIELTDSQIVRIVNCHWWQIITDHFWPKKNLRLILGDLNTLSRLSK